MKTALRMAQAGLVVLLLLSSALVLTGQDKPAEAARSRLITFPSYININYDASALNEPLAIDQSINIPINISYTTDIPETFGRFLPWQIRNIILFGSMIGPMQKIHVEVINAPDWADIFIAQQDLFVSIPFENSQETAQTSLVISPREEAPAVPQSIDLKATSESIGRIQAREIQRAVSFTPRFIPTISITPEEPTRTVGPRESIGFQINVKNNGNKKVRVTPQLININNEWTPTINPPFQDIQAEGEANFVFSIYSPFDFGWHNEIESFQLDFTAQIFPLRDDAPVGGPYSIYLRVNNYGFSTPGFEMVVFLAAAIFVGLLIRRRHLQA